MKAECFDYCCVCNEPLHVGDQCYEIGVRPPDKVLICADCYKSITPYDTVKAYKELTGDDEDV